MLCGELSDEFGFLLGPFRYILVAFATFLAPFRPGSHLLGPGVHHWSKKQICSTCFSQN